MSGAALAEGHVAVVTGGGSGIGRALAIRLAQLGMRIAVVDLKREAAEATVAALPHPARGRAFAADVADAGAMRRCAEAVSAAFGPVNLLCNNAGILRAGTAWTTSESDWALTLGINVRGVVNGLAAFVPGMIDAGKPARILNTASIGGLCPAPGVASYIASKYAVVGLTETLRDELAAGGHDHIGVSLLCPGGVATDIWQGANDAGRPSDRLARDVLQAMSAPRPDQASAEGIAGLAVEAMLAGRFWIVAAQPSLHGRIAERHRAISEAIGRDSPGLYG
ncbi:SDR family NAD(P)-dependent oxidoreductase [Rhizorhabdus dicambivorans]|nr:SDR family NAD(P)-dependent oxidoreductase [Rhizorhabdus dicambivorans]